jgi:hypothetical protein
VGAGSGVKRVGDDLDDIGRHPRLVADDPLGWCPWGQRAMKIAAVTLPKGFGLLVEVRGNAPLPSAKP